MTRKRKGTKNMVSQNGGSRETNKNSDCGKRPRSRGQKRGRQMWVIQVSNVRSTVQVMDELERFFIKRVCPWEKKLLSKGFVKGDKKNDSSLGASPKEARSFYFEFLNQPQQQAALKLDGSVVGTGSLKIRPWVKESAENNAPETHKEDPQPPPSPGIRSNIELTSRPIELHALSQYENDRCENPPNENNVAPHHLMEAEIKAKDRLLAASNEHIKVLTGMNSKYEKRLADQFNQIEDLKAKLQGQRHEQAVKGVGKDDTMEEKSQRPCEEKEVELGIDQSEIKSQEQQDEFIRNQAKRIGDLEAELKIQKLHNVAKDERNRHLETALAKRGDELVSNQQRQQVKIANQKREIAKLQAKLNKRDPRDATPNIDHQHEHSSQVPAGCLDATSIRETETPVLRGGVEALKLDLMDTIVLKDFAVDEKNKLQRQLKDSAREKETFRVELTTKLLTLSREKETLVRENQTLQNRLNYSIKENRSLRIDFQAKEQAINHNIGFVETELKSLRCENQKLLRKVEERNDLELEARQLRDNLMVAERSIANLKETVRKVNEEMLRGGVNIDNKGPPHDNDILLQQLDTEIEAKKRLLAAANAHVEVLTERSSKYEKRLWDQTSQIEDLKARLINSQPVEKEKSKNEQVAKDLRDRQEECIRIQGRRITDLEAELKRQQLDNAAKERKNGNQRLQLASLERKLKKRSRQVAGANSQQNKQSSQVPERRLDKASMPTTRDSKGCGDDSLRFEKDTPALPVNGSALNMADRSETLEIKEEVRSGSRQKNDPIMEQLEAKLIKALQDQNKLLQENQQLRHDKQTMQRTISTMEVHEEENRHLREENEQLLEEIEQMRMNQAMEIGFMEGSEP